MIVWRQIERKIASSNDVFSAWFIKRQYVEKRHVDFYAALNNFAERCGAITMEVFITYILF